MPIMTIVATEPTIMVVRRTTLTSLTSGEYELHGGIPIFTAAAIKAIRNPLIASLLEHEPTVLTCFAASSIKLQKEIKRFEILLRETRQPLTEKLDQDLTEFDNQQYEARETRRRAQEKMNFEEILKGAIALKRYNLYLSTRISELMSQP